MLKSLNATLFVLSLLGPYLVPACGGPQSVGTDPADARSKGDGGAIGAPLVLSAGPEVGMQVVLPPPAEIDAGESAPGTTASVPSDEVCNGIDDDGNGIIDDVDVNHDGVCDCIRIATLGKAGTWGKGDVFGTWLSARASDGAKSLGNQVITADLVKGFQIIVVQDVREEVLGRKFLADEVSALADWVHAGGGLMTLIGFAGASEINNVNLLLAPFGMRYRPDNIMAGFASMTTPVTSFPNQHPITANVRAVGANNGRPVEGEGTPYAQWKSFTVGLAQEVDKGHVDMWGDEWITYNSEWTNHPDYQVQLFWVSTIKWLTPVANCQVAIPPEIIL